MSKEFLDRLARGELTNIDKYRETQQALTEMKNEDAAKSTPADQEWQNWELSPVWSASSNSVVADKKPADDVIQADSVQRALDAMDK